MLSAILLLQLIDSPVPAIAVIIPLVWSPVSPEKFR
jgi:hypothetical protein